jgi:hypothetical protein
VQRRQKGRQRLDDKGRTRGSKMTTPMVVSTNSPIYDMPDKCKGKHHYEDAHVTITFEKENIFTPYFPVKFARACTKCAEVEQP